MKIIGTTQFEQKTYKTIKIDAAWRRFLGNLMHGIILIVYGLSGNGKTEFLLQLLKELVKHGRCIWLSYEQGHGMDLQMAMNRNKDDDWRGGVIWANPWEDLPSGFKEPLLINGKPASVLFQDLVNQVSKRQSPLFWFIDSIQDTLFTYDEYKYLVTRFPRKSFIIISRGKGKEPEGSTAGKIKFNGHIGIRVSDFIAYNDKNRMGGSGEWIVFEESARERNPLYFEIKDKEEKKAQRKSKKAKSTV